MLDNTQARIALDHVLGTVLGFSDEDHPMCKAFDEEGICTIFDLMTMSMEQVDKLAFTFGTRKAPVPKKMRNKVKIFKDYWLFRFQNGNPVGDNFLGITEENLSEFQMCCVGSVFQPNMHKSTSGMSSHKRLGTTVGEHNPENVFAKDCAVNELSQAFIQNDTFPLRHVMIVPPEPKEHRENWFNAVVRNHNPQNILDKAYLVNELS